MDDKRMQLFIELIDGYSKAELIACRGRIEANYARMRKLAARNRGDPLTGPDAFDYLLALGELEKRIAER